MLKGQWGYGGQELAIKTPGCPLNVQVLVIYNFVLGVRFVTEFALAW